MGVGVDYGSLGVGITPLDQVFGKKLFLAVPIRLHVLVVVQVILGQIGENSDIQVTSENPVQVDGVGGNLHDHMGYAICFHLPQDALKIQRLWRRDGVVERFLVVAVVDRPDDPHVEARFFEDAFKNVGGRGFTVGSRNPDEGELLGRVTEKSIGQGSERPACIPDRVNRDVGRKGVLGDNGCGSPLDGIIDKIMPIEFEPFNGDKQAPGTTSLES